MKMLFLPVSVVAGLAAGTLSKKVFGLVWGAVDDGEPPEAEHRQIDQRKLVAALALEGAISSVVRGVFDHYTRHGFARLTGAWPGEEAPESA